MPRKKKKDTPTTFEIGDYVKVGDKTGTLREWGKTNITRHKAFIETEDGGAWFPIDELKAVVADIPADIPDEAAQLKRRLNDIGFADDDSVTDRTVATISSVADVSKEEAGHIEPDGSNQYMVENQLGIEPGDDWWFYTLIGKGARFQVQLSGGGIPDGTKITLEGVIKNVTGNQLVIEYKKKPYPRDLNEITILPEPPIPLSQRQDELRNLIGKQARYQDQLGRIVMVNVFARRVELKITTDDKVSRVWCDLDEVTIMDQATPETDLEKELSKARAANDELHQEVEDLKRQHKQTERSQPMEGSPALESDYVRFYSYHAADDAMRQNVQHDIAQLWQQGWEFAGMSGDQTITVMMLNLKKHMEDGQRTASADIAADMPVAIQDTISVPQSAALIDKVSFRDAVHSGRHSPKELSDIGDMLIQQVFLSRLEMMR